MTPRSNSSVICNVYGGARSGTSTAALHPEVTGITWSRDISVYLCGRYMFQAPRKANRRCSWSWPGIIWNSHAAPNTGRIYRSDPAPSQGAQGGIALGNRGPRHTKACSAASRGILLERVSSSTHGTPSASTAASPLSNGCEVNPWRRRSWSSSTKLLV